MSRSVIRKMDWTLGADTAEGALPTTREIECGVCLEKSGTDAAQLGPDSWALVHAGRTGHTEYSETMRVPLRATPRD